MSTDGILTILSESCEECPFKGGMNLAAGRLKSIVDECARDDSYFVCHKTVDYSANKRGADAVYGPAAVCAGFLEACRFEPTVVQVATRLGIAERVAPYEL